MVIRFLGAIVALLAAVVAVVAITPVFTGGIDTLAVLLFCASSVAVFAALRFLVFPPQ